MFLLLAAAALAVPLPPDDAADGRCVTLLGYLGAHGSPEQVAAATRMAPFFVGRLSARHPAAEIATIVTRAADEARTGAINAQGEGARCQAAFQANMGGFSAGLRAAAGQP